MKAVLGRKIAGADHCYEALYFTRALAPYPRDGDEAEFYLHVGAYAYSKAALLKFASAREGRNERIEKLEQLRILEMGEKIAIRLVDIAARGIDTAADLQAARARLAGK